MGTQVTGDGSKLLREGLDDLFDAANRAVDAGASTSDFEPAFVRLLAFVRENPECQPAAEARFVGGVRSGALSWELVAFCMNTLRYRAVEDEVRRLLAELPDPRHTAVLLHMLDAFGDAWEDAEMYAYYRGRA